MKTIICYCSGGLGNRLKPLASCYYLSLLTNRQLMIVWEPTLRCLAPFESLFQNNIHKINESDLRNLNNTKVYCPQDAADYEYNLNKLRGLKDLVARCGSEVIDTNKIIKDNTENIIVFSNTSLPDLSHENQKSFFLYYLKPLESIREKVMRSWIDLQINSDFIGVHARGTDFEAAGINANYYLDRMSLYSSYDFFVCSDSKEYEEFIKEKDGRNVVIRTNKIYVSKKHDGSWSNNVYTPTESVQDSMVDLLLLAKTNFCIYHPTSSFAHLVELFKGWNHLTGSTLNS